MMPPFTGYDIVRVMRHEMNDRNEQLARRRPFERAEALDPCDTGTDGESMGSLRRLLALLFISRQRCV